MKLKTALTIAGSDCSGGAGIQADLKTMTMNGVYAMSAITALTAQNTTGLRRICEVEPGFLADQLDAIFEDIFPDAVKIGMVSSSALIEVIAEKLRYYGAKNIVVDPVITATSGSRLLKNDSVTALTEKLFPMAFVVTPNIPEAEILSGMKIIKKSDMEKTAQFIGKKFCCAVLLKGGHRVGSCDDILYEKGKITWFKGDHIENPNTHGTGCTLSSAITANLAKGMPLYESIKAAKEYVSGAIFSMLDLGKGSGPLDHAFILNSIR